MQAPFNTQLVKFEVVPTKYGPQVHLGILDGYDEAHTIIIDRESAAEIIRDAANVFLGTSELWKVAQLLEEEEVS